tara:strand:+ start:514 stop:798 length:285 start_codon:yes stop_codon:yes gene_type:complete
MSEASLQRYFKREAAKHKIFWRKIAFDGHRGCPDVFVAHKRHIMLVELKNPNHKGVISKKQANEITRLRDAGVTVNIIDNRGDIDALIKDLAGS